jgi:serine phosphatase RsbU (regulator of sigma subunit)
MAQTTFVDKFIYPKDKEDPQNRLKGQFFVWSTWILFFLCIVSTIYYPLAQPQMIEDQQLLFVFNIIFTIGILALLFIYKRYGGRVLMVNIITGLGFLGSLVTYEAGGIYAPDNMWGFLIAAWVFLVANRLSGIVWMLLTISEYILFYYAEVHRWKDFHAVSAKIDSVYFFINLLLGSVFLLLITHLHEKSKEKFITIILDSKAELESKSKELEIRNKDVTDSINYAKRIQYAVLPNEETIYRSIPLSFIYYKPKDIVSGDFFWFHEINRDEYILVCADCTGHGVPGAFMTVIGSSLLNQTVIDNKITEPSLILMELDKLINFTLKQQKDNTISVQDGMDLSLIKVNKAKKEFIITGAKRPVAFIRDKQLQELKGSKFSLGGMRTGEKHFNEIKMNYREEDMLYFYTDGYTDQFGGEKGKKFSSKRLKEHFLSIHRLSVSEQKQNLGTTMNKWMNSLEQVDDMLVIGIKL